MDADLRALADRIAIQDVIALYARGQDAHQGGDDAILQDWDRVFTQDSVTDYSVAGAPVCSHRELARWMRGGEGEAGRMSGFTGWQHMLSLPVVTLDGDAATARTDYLAIHRQAGRDARFDAAGAFHDWLVRTPAGWRIAKRVLEVYFGAEVPLAPADSGQP